MAVGGSVHGQGCAISECKCKVQSAKCKVQSAKCKMASARSFLRLTVSRVIYREKTSATG